MESKLLKDEFANRLKLALWSFSKGPRSLRECKKDTCNKLFGKLDSYCFYGKLVDVSEIHDQNNCTGCFGLIRDFIDFTDTISHWGRVIRWNFRFSGSNSTSKHAHYWMQQLGCTLTKALPEHFTYSEFREQGFRPLHITYSMKSVESRKLPPIVRLSPWYWFYCNSMDHCKPFQVANTHTNQTLPLVAKHLLHRTHLAIDSDINKLVKYIYPHIEQGSRQQYVKNEFEIWKKQHIFEKKYSLYKIILLLCQNRAKIVSNRPFWEICRNIDVFLLRYVFTFI
jgi:hypothetical protein